MNNIDLIKSFSSNNYSVEYSSGHRGYRHNLTSEWVYDRKYFDRMKLKYELEEKIKFLSQFRSECLPFGEYPDFVLMEFLDKYFDKKVKEAYNVT
jgi:hypothetical protein